MNTSTLIVIGITTLLCSPGHCNLDMDNHLTLIKKHNNIFNQVFKKCKSFTTFDKRLLCYLVMNVEGDELYDIFNKYSLIELKEYLNLLIPFASNQSGNGSSSSYMTIKSLKFAIEFIEKEILSLNNQNKNVKDLININKALENECFELKGELMMFKGDY